MPTDRPTVVGVEEAIRYQSGQTVLRRYFRERDKLILVQCLRVISDDEYGLLLWIPAGTVGRRVVAADGRQFRDMSWAEWQDAPKRFAPWEYRPYSLLILMPPRASYAISWMFRDGEFSGWYANLESPAVRWANGLDLVDQDLDLVVAPDGRWQWKDEDEFEASTAMALDWTAEQAMAIRAEGLRLAALAEAAAYPFDGRHTDFQPGPWPHPTMLDGWDRPRHHPPATAGTTGTAGGFGLGGAPNAGGPRTGTAG